MTQGGDAVPASRAPSRRRSPVGLGSVCSVSVLVGSVLAVVGSCLVWLRVTETVGATQLGGLGGPHTFVIRRVHGIHYGYAHVGYSTVGLGWLTLLLALAAVGFQLIFRDGPRSRWSGIAAIVSGGWSVLVAVKVAHDIHKRNYQFVTIHHLVIESHTGLGLRLTMIGGIVLAVAGLVRVILRSG